MSRPSQPAPPPPVADQLPIGVEAFGFDLNNREIATLIYIALIALVLLLWPRMRGSLGRLVTAALHPKLTAVYLVMSLYVALCTLLRHARCRALLTFGLDGAQRLTRAIRLMGSPDRAAVDARSPPSSG